MVMTSTCEGGLFAAFTRWEKKDFLSNEFKRTEWSDDGSEDIKRALEHAHRFQI